ncbi:efflux RND transporter periplasmic adaptor subunit [Syntrophomonas wolfei]|jgi:HlyD family secretion protein|uniref:efflux RND transporter periplasmic adaptor subunit n=1 Tax=Syntrophomonas wolfei TaxID=863 RepID=UPI0023F1B6A1|nr:efflux RND transporter periplasmic adaptor subunit [Syntrophomonas wolfei]
MKSKKNWIIGGLILLALIAAAAMMAISAEPVEVVQASRGTFTLTLEETAYVQAADDRELQAASTAQVRELLVASGDKVMPGQLLMKLSSPELTAETASARSQLARTEAELQAAGLKMQSLRLELKQAENDLARKKTLLQSRALAQAEYEEAELEVDKLRKTVSQQEAGVSGLSQQVASLSEMFNSLEEKREQLQVTSPVSGIILDLPVKVGQVVAPGTLLAQLGSAGQLEVKAELLSDEIRRVRIGQSTRITAPVLGEEVLSAQVSKIYPRAYEKTSALGVIQRRVPVIITLEQTANLQPGYEVRVAIETLRKEGVILLPRESVRLDEKGHYRVWLVKEGRIEQRSIQVGEKNQQWVEVIKGIQVGETVVRDGSRELKKGSRVKALKQDESV